MLSEIQSNEPANELFFSIGDEPALSRDEAVALINLPDDRVDELLLRAGALRKKYKGDHPSSDQCKKRKLFPELRLLRPVMSFFRRHRDLQMGCGG